MILLTSFWLISQAFLSDCNPTDPFILKGTVAPTGNYHIYVRTVSSAYLSAILRSYDKEISNVKASVNKARMWHSDIPNLLKQRFDAETSFELLGQSEIVNDSKFEIQLDWTKVHNAYFDRKKHPIYVQIYTKNNSAETSLMERILIDPSPMIEYKFLYGEPRNQSGVQKLLLGHVPIGSKKAENYKVKIHKGNNPLVNPINDLLADTDDAGVLSTNVNGHDKTVIKNLPEFDGRQVTKIEVKITYDARRNTTSKVIKPEKRTNKGKNEFEFNDHFIQSLTVTPIEFEPAEKYPSFQHKLTYPTLASTPICSENMKSLIQFEESDGEEALCWRYNFEKGLKNDGIGMSEEKAKMINLYKTYLKERSDITNAEHIPDISSNAEGIHVNVDAYALSLQMVGMKKIGNN
ncbi:hypothetical protein GPALN_010136 [Globodera pallida]|nr:hypothetical protein GPALN_010136 [Globodera pallida]